MTPTIYTSTPFEMPIDGAHIDLPMPTGHGAIRADSGCHFFTVECGATSLHFYGTLDECAQLMGAVDPLVSDEPTVTPQRAQDRWHAFFTALDGAGVEHAEICRRFRAKFPRDAAIRFDDASAAALAAE